MAARSMIAASLLLASYLTGTAAAQASAKDFTKHVNLFIGTEGPDPGSAFAGGNVFPGASLPWGAVKVGIDTTRWNVSFAANAGYTPSGNVTAITMLHESGTGGAPTYGLIPQMPLTSLEGVNLLDNITYMQPRTSPDVASVGYYRTHLSNGVVAEMSASMHAGIMRYSYPPDAPGRHVLVDISHFLPSMGNKQQWYSNGFLERSEDGTWYSGYGIYRAGWSWGGDYRVYFCANFDTTPSSARLFSGKATDPFWPNTTDASPTFTDATTLTAGAPNYQYADRIGALFEFPAGADVVQSRVGVSWISADKACQFLRDEIPTWDLNTTVAKAVDKWNSEVLGKVATAQPSSGAADNETALTMLYTALYHSHLLPSDRTGENPHWDSGEPYYDDWYTLWDTFRTLHPLVTLILPERQTQMVRALIDIWRHERWMPEGRSHNFNGRVQGGSNSDNVLADAYVKGLGVGAAAPGGGLVNWTDGYAAMRTNAERLPYNNFDTDDPSGSTKEGRGALNDWLAYGFVSANKGRCISKTVEYSLNDFAVSQVARGVAAPPHEAATYLNRSRNWQHLWSDDAEALGFKGFLAPRWPNGSIAVPEGSRGGVYDPLTCGACTWRSITYEGTPWEYSFTIPHDMRTLVAKMGGPASFEARLDKSFVPGLGKEDQGANGAGTMIFNPGNEPSFMTPFLYSYIPGKQHKSANRSRAIVDEFYHAGRNGIPGNDDAGAMSSWLVWNMIGLYPVVTQPVYLVLAPRFEDVTVTLGESGGKLRIVAKGLAEAGNTFVQSLKVNGQPWDRSWVSHEDLVGKDGARGGLLEFEMGPEPVAWDTGDVPPSPGHAEV
ncbi:hypothetical protein RB601_008864 [Gaeumannomyces tritici]